MINQLISNIKSHYLTYIFSLIFFVAGVGATSLVAIKNGVPGCSLLNICDTDDPAQSGLSDQIQDAIDEARTANEEAILAKNELSDYKQRYDSLFKDMNSIMDDMKTIQEQENDAFEQIRQQTQIIRRAMDRINQFSDSK